MKHEKTVLEIFWAVDKYKLHILYNMLLAKIPTKYQFLWYIK